LLKQQSDELAEHESPMEAIQRCQRTEGINRRESEIKSLHREVSANDTAEVADRNEQSENEKISVYRVEKKRMQSLAPKLP
jgi:hypothetical protein